MLKDTHLNRYADVLLWGLQTARPKKFKKGEIVLVRFHRPAFALAEILHQRLMENFCERKGRSVEPDEHNLPFLELSGASRLQAPQ